MRSLVRRNFAFFKLGVLTNLEYRLNFFFDVVLQPIIMAGVEATLWIAVFASTAQSTFGGFDRDHYLAYVIWSAFVARLTVNWQYEMQMITEIESGTINSLIVRPTSFFEYYLSQFLGYKFLTTIFSLMVPVAISFALNFPVMWERLPAVLGIGFLYLIFLYVLSFIVATSGFFMTRIWGLTVAKNLALALVSGELIPLDLYPEPWKHILLQLPFANGVFIPVGYLTGRIGSESLLGATENLLVSIGLLAVIAVWFWRQGLRKYVGTGA